MDLRASDLLKGECPLFILPFADEKRQNSAGNCQRLFGALGCPSFVINGFLASHDAGERQAAIVIAADLRKRFSAYFWIKFLESVLTQAKLEITYIRYETVKMVPVSLFQERKELYLTEALALADGAIHMERRQESPYAEKKIKSLFDVLNRKAKITVKSDQGQGRLPVMVAEPASAEALLALYRNAEGFIKAFLETGGMGPEPMPDSGKFAEKPYSGFEDTFYAIKRGEADSDRLERRVLSDAALSRIAGASSEPFDLAFNDGVQKAPCQKDRLYWKLLKNMRPALKSESIAMSRGYIEELGYMDNPRQIEPLAGIDGAARLEIAKDALNGKGIDFGEYLAMAGKSLGIDAISVSPAPARRAMPWVESDSFYFCLPLRPEMKFPESMLRELGCSVSSSRGKCDGEERKIIFSFFSGMRETLCYLMFTLAMGYDLDFLLFRDGAGAVYHINCDKESENLGAIEKAGEGSFNDNAYWEGMLDKFSGRKWQIAKAEKTDNDGGSRRFGGGMMAAVERARASALLYEGQESLKSRLGLKGAIKNAMLYYKDDPEYSAWTKYMAAGEKPDLATFFKGDLPILYVGLDTYDQEGKDRLIKGLANAGCLVCLLAGGDWLMARNIIPTSPGRDYWDLLKDAVEPGFIGYSIGKPWWDMPLEAGIGAVAPPVGSLDGALFRDLIFKRVGYGENPLLLELEPDPDEGYFFALKNGRPFMKIS